MVNGVAELTYDVVAGGLLIQNLYERGPVLCSARSASVCLLTELQNSSSVSCFDASPSAGKVSSSSGVPAKPGTVRCSTAVKAASTTSSTDDGSAPALLFRREMNRHGVVALWVRQILCSIHRRQRYRQGSWRQARSFSFSRGAKTLRPNLVAFDARGDEEVRCAFYERCVAADLASWGKRGLPSRVSNQSGVDTPWRSGPILGNFPRVSVWEGYRMLTQGERLHFL